MKVIEDEGFCTACGNYLEYKYGEDNFSYIKKDLSSYQKYKDIFLFECPVCSFISDNISSEEGILHANVAKTYEFKKLYSYAHLNGLDKELYNNFSSKIPANLYEAYALICLESKNFEKYVRVVNKCIELKELMAFKYSRAKDEVAHEEGNAEQYAELNELINEGIKTNREQINFYFQYVENKNVFVSLIYIENLIKMNLLEDAQKEFSTITKKHFIDDDLKNYFQNLINN